MIRRATEDDLPRIIEMSRRFYSTTSYNRFTPMSEDSCELLASMLIDTGVMLVADVGESNGGVVGMVGLVVAPFFFNDAVKTATEIVWWVEPEWQKAGIGKALLDAVEPACKEAGAVAVQMVHLANSPPQAAALYESRGYAHSESSYTKEITSWPPSAPP